MTCARCRKVSRSRAKFGFECGARFARDAQVPADVGRVPLDRVRPVLTAIARTAARLCDAKDALLHRVEGGHYRLIAQHGVVRAITTLLEPQPINRRSVAGCAILDKRTIHVRDLAVAARRRFPESAPRQRGAGARTVLVTPLVLDGAAVGVIVIRRARVRPFTARQIALLKTFADQAAIAIENARLFTELDARNRDLTEALEQQTATAEIPRVISSSPTDVQPVFDAIVQSATRLCDAAFGAAFRFDGELQTLTAHHNVTPGELEILRRRYPTRATRGAATGRAILDRRVVHIPDIRQDPEYTSPTRQALGFRTVLAVPMLREGEPIGGLGLWRRDVRPFTDKQIALMTTFADQAVIAIENVRLFTELEARNRDLAQALEQKTATSEILRVIASSPTDLQPVFDTIVSSAVRLLGGFSATLRQLAGDRLDLVAFSTTGESGDEALRGLSQLLLAEDPLFAQVVHDHAPCLASDTETDPRVGVRRREVARARGYRSMLIVPMLGGGSVIGAITVTRREPGPFADDQVDLLQTFRRPGGDRHRERTARCASAPPIAEPSSRSRAVSSFRSS